MIIFKEPFIFIETKNNILVFEIKDFVNSKKPEFNKGKKFIVQKYYGKKENTPKFVPSTSHIDERGCCDEYIEEMLITSSFGNGNNAEPSVLIENVDGTLVNRFFFVGANVKKDEEYTYLPHARKVSETLQIIENDEVTNTQIVTEYSSFEDSDVIACRRKLVNSSDKPLHIKRFFSLETPIDANYVKIYSYDGAWVYERSRKESTLSDGVFINQSLNGSSSHKRNPFIEVHDEVNDKWYAYNIFYSGNHKETIETYSLGHTTVMVGINDFGFDYLLNGKETFTTPEAIMCVADSLDELTIEMHNFINNHVINPKFAHEQRSIIFNSWEGTMFDINEDSLFEMAKIAKRVGVELFVMDDGWFKNRVDDFRALGDWSVDKKKFPNGLKTMVDKIRGLGLKFGIWIEPEMISVDSDIYRAHPEYASVIPGRDPIERRNQLIIDMANPQVVDYIYDSLCKVFDEIKPDYVKWDFNRNLVDNYSKNVRSGEYCYRFVNGTYDLGNRLTTRYPDMFIEGCSSGGGRFDLGMLYYTPQIWGSDDTHTACRTFITCGTLAGYPQSCFGAHASRDASWMPGKGSASFEDRFNLNAIGSFGYEFDFRTFEESELQIMMKQVAFYKQHRELLQFGDYYVIDNIFDDTRYYSFVAVSEDKEDAILVTINQDSNAPAKKWLLKGLNPDFKYEVTMRPQYNVLEKNTFKGVYTGKQLMEKGIKIGKLNNTTDANNYATGIFSRMFYIKHIN